MADFTSFEFPFDKYEMTLSAMGPGFDSEEFGVFVIEEIIIVNEIINVIKGLTLMDRGGSLPTKIPNLGRLQVADTTTNVALTKITTTVQAMVDFLFDYTNPSPWVPLNLVSGWVDFSNTVTHGSYTQDPLGYVRLRGTVKRSTGSSAVITRLPAFCTPEFAMSFPVLSAGALAYVTISAAGDVTLTGGTPATSVVLDGIQFDTRV